MPNCTGALRLKRYPGCGPVRKALVDQTARIQRISKAVANKIDA
jgi:hypothetical protein